MAGRDAGGGHRLTIPFAAGDFLVPGKHLGLAESHSHPLHRYSAAAAIGYSHSVSCRGVSIRNRVHRLEMWHGQLSCRQLPRTFQCEFDLANRVVLWYVQHSL